MQATEHKFYQQAVRAHNWSSFSPEKRAIQDCEYYDSVCKEFADVGKESAIVKFTALFLKSLAAKSRCASPMVAGPANFPLARMRKYNQWEENATRAMYDFVKKVMAPPKQPRHEIKYKFEQKEINVGDVKVVQNLEANRLQLIFPGKPDFEIIQKLKQNGFKWSPRFKAWQRQLTPNAITAFKYILPEISTQP